MYFTDTAELRKFEREMKQKPKIEYTNFLVNEKPLWYYIVEI